MPLNKETKPNKTTEKLRIKWLFYETVAAGNTSGGIILLRIYMCIYIYIYIYVCVCVCVCVEMIDWGEPDNMIEICGKLDKSNT